MNDLPLELIQYIFDFLDFESQMKFRVVCKGCYIGLRIYDFYNIPEKYKTRLNNIILKNFPYLKYLDVFYNKSIIDINHLVNLQILSARGADCGISDKNIKKLNLIELYASDNPKIINVNHMTNLQTLYATGDCGIDNNSIKNLNLTRLYASNNPKITNVNHMTNLIKLHVTGDCGINDDGIKNLNLIELYANGNSKITNVTHMIE
jgi:hypothetical protein